MGVKDQPGWPLLTTWHNAQDIHKDVRYKDSQYQLFQDHDRIQIWHNLSATMVGTLQTGSASIMIWSMFTWLQLGLLVHINKSSCYIALWKFSPSHGQCTSTRMFDSSWIIYHFISYPSCLELVWEAFWKFLTNVAATFAQSGLNQLWMEYDRQW